MRKLVLWGHGIAEYKAMFDLTDENLHSRILEYGCGTSAVNALLYENAPLFVSCDPLFDLPKQQLKAEVSSLFEHRAKQLLAEQSMLDVSAYGSFENLIKERRAGCDVFLSDYDQGSLQERYITELNHQLPFADFTFDFALSSHYLFTEFDSHFEMMHIEEHIQIIRELARVANEVRIFPVIDKLGQASPLLGPILLGLSQANYGVEVREVPYSLYTKGNVMLRVWAQACAVM
jgi:SAM-dependent methyltransferase